MAPPPAGGSRLLVLPLRNQVIFPSTRGAIDVLKDTFEEIQDYVERTGSSNIGVLAIRHGKKKDADVLDDYYSIGTVCKIVPQSPSGKEKDTGNRIRLVVEGLSRFKLLSWVETDPVRVAQVELIEEGENDSGDVAVRALVHSVQEKMTELVKGSEDGAKMLKSKNQLRWPSAAGALTSVVGSTLSQLSLDERQKILETLDLRKRLEVVLDLLQRETEARRLAKDISAGIQKSREQELRGVVLQRQIQEVQKDLQKIREKRQRESDTEDGEAVNDDEEEEDEVARLAEKLEKAKLPEDAARVCKKELRRLKSLQPQHPEYTITHTYLELMSNLPWRQTSEDRFDISYARKCLEEDHRGLEKVKTRILEFLAVQKMRGNMNGPILCLHGPPGIGKTSLGRSVARALGRKFHRIALGGVRDEAELRGHRRTYIGSIPGVLINAFQTLGVNNPVILLDEVDKMSQNSMFNPQATMLEILDPEQNSTFKDHYLNTPFDLSKVLFICTANDTSLIDRPLLDRMEVIDLAGYTVEEKLAITTTHLLPKQRRLHALEEDPAAPSEPVGDAAKASTASAESEEPSLSPTVETVPAKPSRPRLQLTNEALTALITKWTAESGVRSLERLLAQICRWAALRMQGINVPGGSGEERDREREAALAGCGPDQDGLIHLDVQHLNHVVGVELFEPDIAERLSVGVAMGLSVSTVGGQLLFIESTKSAGPGKLVITGQLGKVMHESVETAMSLLRGRFVRASRGAAPAPSEVLNFLHSAPRALAKSSDKDEEDSGNRDPFKGDDIHVHFPAGGIPKDGPSAGVAVLLSLASLLLGRPMRSDTAITGEITLRGHVLPVGGIRDKVLAASRAGVRHVMLPLANKRNVLEDIPAKTLKGIEVHYVKHIDEALDWAFGIRSGMTEEAVAAITPSPALPSGVGAAAYAAHVCRASSSFLPPRPRL